MPSVVLLALAPPVAATMFATGLGQWLSAPLQVYMPRSRCMFGDADVIWTHAISDATIALSYFSIPVALAFFVRRRGDVGFSGVFWLFAAFIFLCGLTHVFGVWALWQPLYRLDGWVKAATAGVSVATAVILWRIMPALVALPSPRQLREVNAQLRTLSGELETRVADRTGELEDRTRQLERAVAELDEAKRVAEQAAAQEAELRHEAERLNRVKDEFLGMLGHELRTPLNAMLGWSQILLEEAATGDRHDRKIAADVVLEAGETIERNARSQAHLVDDLLDVSRILSGRMRLETSRLPLDRPVRRAIEVVRPAAEARGVEIAIEDADAMGRDVIGDVDRLQQVAWNLLSNAVKFTPRGGRVTVSAEADGREVRLVIRDTGEGIRPEFVPRLFEAFEQAEVGATRRRGGLGLGLNIVRRITELHGGHVSARSDGPGQGATFVVALPEAPPEANPAASPPRSPAGSSQAAGDFAGLRVLLVEDDADSRRVLRRTLERDGVSVIEADSAAAALEAFGDRGPFDVLLSDIGMPEVDGYELMRRIREAESLAGGEPTTAIALTAYAREQDRRAARDAGYDHHLAKPVDHAALRRHLRDVANGRLG